MKDSVKTMDRIKMVAIQPHKMALIFWRTDFQIQKEQKEIKNERINERKKDRKEK